MKRLLLSVALFACALGVAGCKPASHPPPPASCLAACDRLAKLDCTNGVTTSDGVECRVWMCETPICVDREHDEKRWGAIAASETCEVARAASCQ